MNIYNAVVCFCCVSLDTGIAGAPAAVFCFPASFV